MAEIPTRRECALDTLLIPSAPTLLENQNTEHIELFITGEIELWLL